MQMFQVNWVIYKCKFSQKLGDYRETKIFFYLSPAPPRRVNATDATCDVTRYFDRSSVTSKIVKTFIKTTWREISNHAICM